MNIPPTKEALRPIRILPVILRYFRAGEEVLHSQSTRDTFYIFAGNGIQAGATFVSIALIARHLSISDFGVFALAFAVLGVVNAFADLGLNTGMIRFSADFLSLGRWGEARAVFRMILKWRFTASMFFVVTGTLAVSYVATDLWREPRLIGPLHIAVAGSLAVVFLSFGTAAHVSARLFHNAVIAWSLSGILRLLAVVALSIVGRLTLTTAIAAMVLGPAMAMIWAFWKGPLISIGSQAEVPKGLRAEIIRFSVWVALSSLFVALRSRADIFLLARFAQPSIVGQYAAAQQLSFALLLLTAALTTALLPRVSALDGIAAIRSYVHRVLKWVPSVVLLSILGLMTPKALIPWIFGPSFDGAVPAARILLAGYSISLIVNPLSLIFFRVRRPQFLTVMNLIQLLTVGILGLLLIPRLGAVGAALSAICAEIGVSVIIGAFGLSSLIGRKHA